MKWEIIKLLRSGHLREFLPKSGRALIDKNGKEKTLSPKQLRIVNTIIKG